MESGIKVTEETDIHGTDYNMVCGKCDCQRRYRRKREIFNCCQCGNQFQGSTGKSLEKLDNGSSKVEKEHYAESNDDSYEQEIQKKHKSCDTSESSDVKGKYGN